MEVACYDWKNDLKNGGELGSTGESSRSTGGDLSLSEVFVAPSFLVFRSHRLFRHALFSEATQVENSFQFPLQMAPFIFILSISVKHLKLERFLIEKE